MSIENENGKEKNKLVHLPKKRRSWGQRLVEIVRGKPSVSSEQTAGQTKEQYVDNIEAVHLPATEHMSGYTAYVMPGAPGKTMEYDPLEPKVPGDSILLQYTDERDGRKSVYVTKYEDADPFVQTIEGVKTYSLNLDADGNYEATPTNLSDVVPGDSPTRDIPMGKRLDGYASVELGDVLDRMIVTRSDREEQSAPVPENSDLERDVASFVEKTNRAIAEYKIKYFKEKDKIRTPEQ